MVRMTNLYIGADLGTSSLKLMLLSADGEIIKSCSETYPLYMPQEGWSEQNPADWFEAFKQGLTKLLEGQAKERVRGIAIAGQMHGLVALDSKDQVIRPAILWNDGRAGKQSTELNQQLGEEALTEYTGNIAFAGFTAPKLLWMKENEPSLFARIDKVMLPKDYLVYCLTGAFASDYSDASGMLLLNVQARAWSLPMLEICGLSLKQMPSLHESYEQVGQLRAQVAEELGLSPSVFVVAGAGDNAAAAIGSGTVGQGKCNVSLGTSGTVLVGSETYHKTLNHAIHNFAHADGSYHYLGCMLSAAQAYDWWVKEILQSQFADVAADMHEKLGQNKVFFLPYLMGERSPHNDPLARAAFIGMSGSCTRTEMSLAVLEGVTFGLKDSLQAIRDLGICVEKTALVGGGAKNPIWQLLIANILQVEVELLEPEVGPSLGSCILAAYAGGEFPSLEAACAQVVKKRDVIKPDQALMERYAERYAVYRDLYPSLKDTYKRMALL